MSTRRLLIWGYGHIGMRLLRWTRSDQRRRDFDRIVVGTR